MFNLGTAVGFLRLNASGVVSGVQAAIRNVSLLRQRTTAELNAWNTATSKVYQKNFFAARDLGTAFGAMGVAIAAGFAMAVNAAIEWETAMAGVARTTDRTGKGMKEFNENQIEALSKGLKNLASVTPVAPSALAAITEEAGALGIEGVDSLLGFTKVVADLDATTNLSAEDASGALARLGNIMGTTLPSDFEKMGSTILELGRSTASTEGEIVSMSRRIAGVGKTVGLTTDQVLSYAAAMASVGIREEMGGSGISRTFIDIQRAVGEAGAELDIFARTAGMSTDEFVTAFNTDAAQATAQFIAGLGIMQQEGMDLIGTLDELGLTEQRQRDVVIRLASNYDLLYRTLNTGQSAWQQNAALQEITQRLYATTGAQIQLLKNEISTAGEEIGQVFLPVVRLAVSVVRSFVQGFQALPGPLRTAYAALLALMGILTGVVAVFVYIVPRINLATQALRQYTNATVVASTASRSLSVALGAIGAVLAVASVALALWGAKQKQNIGISEEYTRKTQELGAAIAAMRGGVQQNIREWLMLDLAQNNVSGSMERLGITFDQVLGEIDKPIPMIGELDRLEARLKTMEIATIGGATPEQQAYMDDLRNIIEYLRGLTNRSGLAKEAQENYAKAAKAAGFATKEESDKIEKLNDNLKKQKELADQVTNASMDLVDARRSAANAVNDVARAEENLAEAKARAKNSALEVRKAELELASARHDVETSLRDIAQAEDDLATARDRQRQAVRDAELDLADAQEGHLDALDRVIDLQEELNDLQSAPSLKDLIDATLKLKEARLSLARANQYVEDAEWQLQYLMAEGASARDIEDAQLALEEARYSQEKATDDVADAEEELQELRAGGDPRERTRLERDLAQAMRDVERAAENSKTAEQDLAKAREDMANDTLYKEAEDALRDARISNAAAVLDITDKELTLRSLRTGDNERLVRDAQNELTDAYYRLATANVEVQKQIALSKEETWDAQRGAAALKAELQRLGEQAAGSTSADLRTMADTINVATAPKVVELNVPTGPALAAIDQIKQANEAAARDSKSAWEKFAGFMDTMWEKVKSFPGWFGDTFVSAVRGLRPYAEGGLVTRPVVGLIGEAGPELILPLSDMRRTMELLQQAGLITATTGGQVDGVVTGVAAATRAGDTINVWPTRFQSATEVATEMMWKKRARMRR